jgi:TolA-binding protein
VEACRQKTSGVLRELATTWHREAQRTQQQDLYELTQQAYRIYLESFPRASDAYTLTFYHAEVLYKLERWAQAAQTYTKVVELDPSKSGKGKHTKEAAYAAVISWKNALNVSTELEEQEHRRRTRSFEPVPIPARQQQMLRAFETYLGLVPNAKERVPILYRMARIHYEHNHFAEAKKLFAEIVTKHPAHELATYAANLLLDCLNIRKKYAEMERWVDRLLKDPTLAKGELLELLKKLKHTMERKIAERLAKERKFRECGERYVKLARAFPDDPRWSEVVYNAGICFEKAKLPDRAAARYKALIQASARPPTTWSERWPCAWARESSKRRARTWSSSRRATPRAIGTSPGRPTSSSRWGRLTSSGSSTTGWSATTRDF